MSATTNACKKIVLVLSLVIGSIAWGAEAKKCPSSDILVKEVIKAELSGWRNSFNNQKCLSKSDFPNIEVGEGVGFDAPEFAKPILLESENQVEVKKVSPTDGKVKIEFEIVQGKKRTKDRLVYIQTEQDQVAKLGCVVLDEPPKHSFLLKKCFLKK